MPAVRILEAAAAEAAGAATWYESQRAGLGADFREDFRGALDTLREGRRAWLTVAWPPGRAGGEADPAQAVSAFCRVCRHRQR